MNKTGIYFIKNIINGYVYIGCSIDIETRIKIHFNNLRNNKHINPLLQSDFNKYGGSAFIWRTLLYCSESELLIKERETQNKIKKSYATINQIIEFVPKPGSIEKFKSNIIKLENGCWTLPNSPTKSGYISIKYINGKSLNAHRVSYYIFKDQEIANQHICHTCDNKYCVNPDHLFKGSASENHKDRSLKGIGYKFNFKVAQKIRNIFRDYDVNSAHDFVKYLGISYTRTSIDNILNNKTFTDKDYQPVQRHKKLNEAIVRNIKIDHRDGMRLCELVNKYGFRADTLSLVVNNKNWKWVQI